MKINNQQIYKNDFTLPLQGLASEGPFAARPSVHVKPRRSYGAAIWGILCELTTVSLYNVRKIETHLHSPENGGFNLKQIATENIL